MLVYDGKDDKKLLPACEQVIANFEAGVELRPVSPAEAEALDSIVFGDCDPFSRSLQAVEEPDA